MPYKDPLKKKQHYIDNKEKYKLKALLWHKENKEKHKLSIDKYKSNSPEKYKKTQTISSWKNKHGIISKDFDETYKYYIDCRYCEWCDEPFKNSRSKHLDHDHTIDDTVNIRGVLCATCNTRDYLGKFLNCYILNEENL